MLKRILFLVIVIIGWQLLDAQPYTLNDGRIRLRVWTHKVWTNANCSDPGVQEYVYRGIRVRPHTDCNFSDDTGWQWGVDDGYYFS